MNDWTHGPIHVPVSAISLLVFFTWVQFLDCLCTHKQDDLKFVKKNMEEVYLQIDIELHYI
jgi:hypothetical protein